MRRLLLVLPVAGIAASVSWVGLQYVQKERAEQVAIATVQSIRVAQEKFRSAQLGYATTLDSLARGCDGITFLATETVAAAERAGFAIELRSAIGESAGTLRDCYGRPVAADYYVAATPRDADSVAQQAFAARAVGDIYLFYDGVAPTELQMATGLATSLDERATFRIP